jgi:multimeric flavodoxin WrbA
MAPKIAIVYYSMYGHIKQMADAELKGIQEAGGDAKLFQYVHSPFQQPSIQEEKKAQANTMTTESQRPCPKTSSTRCTLPPRTPPSPS